MRLAYQYRLRPTKQQIATFEHWLEWCRRQYNYRLAERFNWYEQNRCDVDRCSIISCSIAPLKDRPDYYSQKRDLTNTKALFADYKELPSHTLKDVIARVEKTFDRWLRGDINGKKFGRPRFKGKGRYRSLTFPDPIKPEHIQVKFIQLPKIGKLKMILHLLFLTVSKSKPLLLPVKLMVDTSVLAWKMWQYLALKLMSSPRWITL